MANKSKGFIKLYRSIQDHWLWQSDKKFDERSAWVDLILSVNHAERKVMINGNLRIIKPGQMWTSYDKLAAKWHWSRWKVIHYTKMLKSDGMIYLNTTPNGTLLTLVNYGNFADGQTTDRTTERTTDCTTHHTTDHTQTRNIKNDKEVKEGKRSARDPLEDY